MSAQILPTFAAAIVAILIIGALRPAPIILVIATSLLLALTWLRLFVLLLAKSGLPGAPAEGTVDAGLIQRYLYQANQSSKRWLSGKAGDPGLVGSLVSQVDPSE